MGECDKFNSNLVKAIAKNKARLERESLVIFYDGEQGSGKSSITNLLYDVRLMDARSVQYNSKYQYFNNPKSKTIPRFDLVSPYIYKFNTTQVQNTDNFNKALLDEIGFILHQNNILTDEITTQYFNTLKEKVNFFDWLKLFPFLGGPDSTSELKDKISKKLDLFDKPVIIIVDEVDRLNPKQVYNLFNSLNFVCNFQNLVFVVNLDFKHVKQTTCFEYFPILKQSSALVSGVYGVDSYEGRGPTAKLNSQVTKYLDSIFRNDEFADQCNKLYQKYYQEIIEKEQTGYSVFCLIFSKELNDKFNTSVFIQKLYQLTKSPELTLLSKNKIYRLYQRFIKYLSEEYNDEIFADSLDGKRSVVIPYRNGDNLTVNIYNLLNSGIWKINSILLLGIYHTLFNFKDNIISSEKFELAPLLNLFSIVFYFENDQHWMENTALDYRNLRELLLTYFVINDDIDRNNVVVKNLINQYFKKVNYRQIISRLNNIDKF